MHNQIIEQERNAEIADYHSKEEQGKKTPVYILIKTLESAIHQEFKGLGIDFLKGIDKLFIKAGNKGDHPAGNSGHFISGAHSDAFQYQKYPVAKTSHGLHFQEQFSVGNNIYPSILM